MIPGQTLDNEQKRQTQTKCELFSTEIDQEATKVLSKIKNKYGFRTKLGPEIATISENLIQNGSENDSNVINTNLKHIRQVSLPITWRIL